MKTSAGAVRRRVAVFEGMDKPAAPDKIWCIHFECYKYINVCGSCRLRIKCSNYLDYWSPRLGF
ncbi:MAG: hypothetical protein OHK006_13560 [Thermodesulfovibrionales bacterium]